MNSIVALILMVDEQQAQAKCPNLVSAENEEVALPAAARVAVLRFSRNIRGKKKGPFPLKRQW